jgi:hypothetical protein
MVILLGLLVIINGYWWLFMDILLMAISGYGCYSINGYSFNNY